MTTALAFVDTETTGLDPVRHHVWEAAVITATHDSAAQQLTVDHRWSQCVELPEGALRDADPMALKIGRFYDRYDGDRVHSGVVSRWEAAAMVLESTRGRHLVGAVPAFDERRLGDLMRSVDLCPTWHYHLIDVEALAAGHIAAQAARAERYAKLAADGDTRGPRLEEVTRLRELAAPPWSSDDLTAELGVTVDDDLRHTAMGDADWAMRTYAAVYGLEVVDQ